MDALLVVVMVVPSVDVWVVMSVVWLVWMYVVVKVVVLSVVLAGQMVA